jgi:hypothetical protein
LKEIVNIVKGAIMRIMRKNTGKIGNVKTKYNCGSI